MVSAKFNEAYSKVSTITSGPTNDDQLNLYAYAKIAKGEDINAAPKPGVFDLKGKAKRNKWQEIVDSGITPEQAEEKYIELVDLLISKHS